MTACYGRAQRWGGPIKGIRPVDVVWIPPGEKHRHGATPSTAMIHIAIQEQLDGKAVDWGRSLTPVSRSGFSSLAWLDASCHYV